MNKPTPNIDAYLFNQHTEPFAIYSPTHESISILSADNDDYNPAPDYYNNWLIPIGLTICALGAAWYVIEPYVASWFAQGLVLGLGL